MFENAIEEAMDITLANEETVTVSNLEYRELIACQTMLDMIIISRKESGYYSDNVIAYAEKLRLRHSDMSAVTSESSADGEADA